MEKNHPSNEPVKYEREKKRWEVAKAYRALWIARLDGDPLTIELAEIALNNLLDEYLEDE